MHFFLMAVFISFSIFILWGVYFTSTDDDAIWRKIVYILCELFCMAGMLILAYRSMKAVIRVKIFDDRLKITYPYMFGYTQTVNLGDFDGKRPVVKRVLYTNKHGRVVRTSYHPILWLLKDGEKKYELDLCRLSKPDKVYDSINLAELHSEKLYVDENDNPIESPK